MQEPRRTEVDGVPVAWVDLDGPLRVALTFRVGIANETVPLHGVTHLVEHLALHQMHDRPYALNGMTDLTRTVFYASGEPKEMTEFLGSVCARLGDLPAERVEMERRVLKAEADARSPAYRDGLLFWRYGAQRHGLAGMDEYGLRWLDADTVRWWAAERFTKANALLVMTKRPPRGMRLPLPEGPAHPPVVSEPTESVIPGWVSLGAAGVGVGGVFHRTTGASLAASVVESELARELRFDKGLTYSVLGMYEPLDAERAHVTFSADADAARHLDLRDGFLAVVERLAADGVPQAVFDAQTKRFERADEEGRLMSYLNSIGVDFSTGRESESLAALDARLRGVTRDDVDECLRELAETALWVVPPDVHMPPEYPPLPLYSRDTVSGETHRYRAGNGALVVGPEGVSRVHEGDAVTVRWSDTVGALWWGDGARVVLGRDGFRVVVVPADWENGAAAVARIDALAPRTVAVPMGDSGPAPASERAPAQQRTVWTRWVFLTLLYLVGLVLVGTGLAGPQEATETQEAVTQADATGMLVFGLVALGAAGFWTWRVVRERRRNRA
jgi:predicted Zn-dependent peptidase